MGYSLVTQIDGSEYRYTEWADFNTAGFPLTVNWARNVGTELYNHTGNHFYYFYYFLGGLGYTRH